jgi:hypothetical protein
VLKRPFFMTALFGDVGRVGAPIVTKAGAGTYFGAGQRHASTRSCSARISATRSGCALPVSVMRAVQVSIQRLSASVLKPRTLLASSTKTNWPSMNSMACGQCGLVGAVIGVAVMACSFLRGVLR